MKFGFDLTDKFLERIGVFTSLIFAAAELYD